MDFPGQTRGGSLADGEEEEAEEEIVDVDVDPSPCRYDFRQWKRPAAQLQ